MPTWCWRFSSAYGVLQAVLFEDAPMLMFGPSGPFDHVDLPQDAMETVEASKRILTDYAMLNDTVGSHTPKKNQAAPSGEARLL